MATLGRYCKAYPLDQVAKWNGWNDRIKERVEAHQTSSQTIPLDHIFIQENYIATAGIFLDEQVLLDDVTPEWIDFCTHTLGFHPPEPQPAKSSGVQQR